MEALAFPLFNGVVFGMVLFLLSSGLTLVFSLMGVLNFAHAAFYMVGAYVAYQCSAGIGFWWGLLAAPLACAALGAAVERWGLRRAAVLGPLAQILFTFGLEFVIEEAVILAWGRVPVPYAVPAELDFPLFRLGGVGFSAYRVFVLAVAVLVLGGLALGFARSRFGLLLRAALSRPDMVMRLGHDLPRLHTGVFAIGCALAGLAGALAGNLLGTAPDMALQTGTLLFVVVVVGGLGSLTGALAASLLLGVAQSLMVASDLSLADLMAWLPDAARPGGLAEVTLNRVAGLAPYALMLLILAARPRGLLGTRDH